MSCTNIGLKNQRIPSVHTILTATGEEAKVVSEGEMHMLGLDGSPVILHNVLYVPTFTSSLLSVSSIFDSGGHIRYTDGGQQVEIFSKSCSTPVLVAEREQDLWRVSKKNIKMHPVSSEFVSKGAALVSRGETLEMSKATLEEWHCRLGHLGWRTLRKIFNKDLVRGAEATDLRTSTD